MIYQNKHRELALAWNYLDVLKFVCAITKDLDEPEAIHAVLKGMEEYWSKNKDELERRIVEENQNTIDKALQKMYENAYYGSFKTVRQEEEE